MGSKSKVKQIKRGETKVELAKVFESEISNFLAWIQLEKGLADNTVSSYENDLVQFAIYLDQSGVSSWQSVDLDNVSSWLRTFTKEEYAISSLSRKLSAVRMLSKFLLGEGILQNDFTELLPNPKKQKHLPDFLTIDEMEKFLSAPNLNTPLGKRDRALFELMYGSGLRVSEICSLAMTAVDYEEGLPEFLEKGRRKELFL